MSAAIFGANLLEEVQEESLDHVLSDLRSLVDPEPASSLGILHLDHLVDILRYPRSTLQTEETEEWTSPSRLGNIPSTRNPTDHEDLLSRVEIVPKPPSTLIELSDTPSTNARTALLYHITARSILPKSHHGKESAVIWLDTNISFSATRLHHSCTSILKKQTSDPPLAAIETHNLVLESIKHVHVFSISSSKQLLSTLDNLPHYLLQQPPPKTDHRSQPNHKSLHRPLALIILNTATAFTWTDKFDAELARLENRSSSTTSAPVQPTSQLVISALKSLASEFGCAVVYTTDHHNNLQQSNTFDLNNDSPALSPWSLAATLSLNISRIPIPQFASHMTLDECLRDREKRQEVVDRARFRIGVDEKWYGVVGRRGGLKGGISELPGRGGFVVKMRDGAVEVE